MVTGGGSGIGGGLCRRFAATGMNVVVADVDAAAAAKCADALREAGARALAIPTDVADRSAVEALAEATVGEFGGVHLVCNNAGVFTGGPLREMTESDWQWLVSVNLMGVVHGSLVFAPLLAQQDEAHVVNTASVGGFLADPTLSIYCATKYAVVGFSEALRVDLAQEGVGVSVLCPGPVATRLADSDRLRPGGGAPGGGRSQLLAPMIDGGMHPDEVGDIVVRGVRENTEYIFTHPGFRDFVAERFERVLAALA